MKRLPLIVLFLLTVCGVAAAQGPAVAVRTVTTLSSGANACRSNNVYTDIVFKQAADATRGYYTCNALQTGWDGPYATLTGAQQSEIFKLTETPPTAATTALAGAGAGNVDNGAHSVKVTCITPAGETSAGTASNATTVADKTTNGKIAITAIPLCSSVATGRDVYMNTVAASTVYKLLSNGVIANNTATTLTANDSDATLAAAATIPSTNTAIDARLTIGQSLITAAVPVTGTTLTASTSVTTPIVKPAADSTTALQIMKADGTTRVVAVDTTNARVGINKTAGAFDLDVNGAVNLASTLAVGSTATITGAVTQTAKTTTYNNEATAGEGLAPIRGFTSQRTVTNTGDTNLLTVTPASAAGTYRITISISITSATSGVVGWTATWTDSNGNAQTPTNLALFQSGAAAPALTFTTSAAGNYYGQATVEINNAGTNIVIKQTGSGTYTGKSSASIERIN